MLKLKVSAPGKVILHGEHAVVYGKTAVAGSLNLRTMAELTELPESPHSNDIIKIEFPNVHLSFELPLQHFINCLCGPDIEHNILYNKVEQFTFDMNNECISNHTQRISIQAFFYLLALLSHKEQISLKSFHMHLSTELTVNAGLGSSASFAVCLAACFLHWSRLQKGVTGDFDKDDLGKISKYAYSCERIMHGTPSGIDNSICTYGSIIGFERGDVDILPAVPNMKILLVNSKISRNTKNQVNRVADLKKLYPNIINPVMDCIDTISKAALEEIGKLRIINADNTTAIRAQYKRLETLIHMNQGLLKTLDVSHPKLDDICSIAKCHSLEGKLTGAGGGGYAYILLPPYIAMEIIEVISNQLLTQDFTVTLTSLGCSGVKIECILKS